MSDDAVPGSPVNPMSYYTVYNYTPGANPISPTVRAFDRGTGAYLFTRNVQTGAITVENGVPNGIPDGVQ